MEELIKQYLDGLVPERPPFFQELERYAAAHRVPIMEPDGMEAMLSIMKIQQPKRILEIGTAIGYSALRMADALPDAEIVTIEMDDERYALAVENVREAGQERRIRLLKGNALELVEEAGKHGPFDAIFIDAAKGQYAKFFEGYTAFLPEKGCVYTDNVLFKGLVAGAETERKRLRNIADKIAKFNQWLMDREDFSTVILPVGDGLAVSRKKTQPERGL